MSFGNNIAARGGLHGWIRGNGANRGGISRAGKIYLPSEPAHQPTELPGANNGVSAASTFPAAAAPSAVGHSAHQPKLTNS
jgi:hypothetical protein